MEQTQNGSKRSSSRSGGYSLKKLFFFLIVLTGVVTSYMMYIYSGPTVEELWEVQESQWKLKQQAWETEIVQLEQQYEQLQLALSERFIDHKLLHLQPYQEDSSTAHAIVTTFVNMEGEKSPGWIHALVLFQSLYETKTRVTNKLALSYNPLDEIPIYAKNAFHRLGVELRYIGQPPMELSSRNEIITWMRSQVFLLTEYKRILYMDSYTIAMDNIDHVLHTPIPAADAGFIPVVTAVNSRTCYPGECLQRVESSARFFVLEPNQVLGRRVVEKIISDPDLYIGTKMMSKLDDIISWAPFEDDAYDLEVGECACDFISPSKYKTMSFTCLEVERIFEDVLGRMFIQEKCTHPYFVLWWQLYSEIIEELQR